MLAVVVVLGVATFVLRATGPALPRIPDGLLARTAGLAPALLAAFVVTELVPRDGVPVLNAKTIGVATAILLAARRAPLVLCVVVGALVTAVARLAGLP